MHTLYIEALRHREQEVITFLTALGFVFGGFGWLLFVSEGIPAGLFTMAAVGALGVLFLGGVYSVAVGYNYRYLTLQLAKLEATAGIEPRMLRAWPRSPAAFKKKYSLRGRPWCTPPEVIAVFWAAFLVVFLIVGLGLTLTAGVVLPLHFGRKLHRICDEENDLW